MSAAPPASGESQPDQAPFVARLSPGSGPGQTVVTVAGDALILVGPRPMVARVLNLTRADELIAVAATVDEALAGRPAETDPPKPARRPAEPNRNRNGPQTARQTVICRAGSKSAGWPHFS